MKPQHVIGSRIYCTTAWKKTPVQLAGEASNGLEALALLQTQHADVVLLDIRMPEMDGLELAQHLLKLPVPPAFIFTTAYDV